MVPPGWLIHDIFTFQQTLDGIHVLTGSVAMNRSNMVTWNVLDINSAFDMNKSSEKMKMRDF